MQSKRGGIPPPKPDEAWLDFDEMKTNTDKRNTVKSAVADNESATLLPHVIMYDQTLGLPINAQDVRAAPGREANICTVPWNEWLRGQVAQHLCEKAAPIAAIHLVLHTRGRVDAAPIDVSIDLNSKRKVVNASEDLPTGALALPPCVPKSSSVFDKSTHPHRVSIIVTEKSAVADGKPDSRSASKGEF